MLGEIPLVKHLQRGSLGVRDFVEAFRGRHRFDITFIEPHTQEIRMISLNTSTHRAEIAYNTDNSLGPKHFVADDALYSVLTSLARARVLENGHKFYGADFEVIYMTNGFKKPEVMVRVAPLNPPRLSQPIGSDSQRRNGKPNIHPQVVFVSGYSLYLKQEHLRDAGISIRYL